MKKIFLGVREPKGDQKRKLFEVTKLDCFRDTEHPTEIIPKEANINSGNEISQDVEVNIADKIIDMTEIPKKNSVNRSEIIKDVKVESIPEVAEETFQNVPNHTIEKILDYIERLELEVKSLREKKMNKGIIPNNGDEVEKLYSAFYLLARSLEPFKHGTSDQRDRVKSKIPAQDLGYVMSFLKALYDEDHFTDFMFFSEYIFKGDKGE